MKLRNKKTGEIIELLTKPSFVKRNDDYLQSEVNTFNSLAELNQKWEDYEEPKEYWYIGDGGEVYGFSDYYLDTEIEETHRKIGNLFETKEEAEKAVEKLKAWKRLKDKGFRFTLTPGVGSLDITPGKFQIEITADMPAKWFCCDAVQKDLEVCFGGEE